MAVKRLLTGGVDTVRGGIVGLVVCGCCVLLVLDVLGPFPFAIPSCDWSRELTSARAGENVGGSAGWRSGTVAMGRDSGALVSSCILDADRRRTPS